MGRITMKCPCCGAELVFGADGKTLSCEYCGHTEYWKEEKTEKVIADLDRANMLRRENCFADAIREYKLITEQNPDDAEAHWGLVISLYGIEFIKDRRTNRFTPTCHRTVRESILENPDYLKAVECASEAQAEEYREQAVEIDRLQKEILRLSDAEEEFDVFISFKSTDERGRITRDAQIARIIYDELTKRGIKTFFSDVTLEKKLFEAFEPIIFRALFSCKFFILVGTKNEFINSPWVKNEWSRFAERMETERLSGVACAVFDGAEVDLPDFVRAQGIDLRRYAAGGYEMHVADAVEKKLGRKKKSKEEEEILKQIEAQKKAQRELEERLKGLQQGGRESTGGGASATVNSLLMRARQELEVKSWDNAKEYYGRVLDADPQNADAWWGLFLIDREAVDDKEAEMSVGTKVQYGVVLHNRNFISAKRYASGKTLEKIEEFEKQLTTEEPLLARADALLKKKSFDRAEEVSSLLLASEPENAKAWWHILLAQENCASEEEFLNKCDYDTVGKTVKRSAYLNAYKYAKDDFRTHLDEIRQKICTYFEPKAQECRDRIVAYDNEAEQQRQQFNMANVAMEQKVNAANNKISKIFSENPILKTYREQKRKRVRPFKCLITAIVFAVLVAAAWIALLFTVFSDMPIEDLSDFVTWGIDVGTFFFPLFLIQGAIYGVICGIGFLILLLITVAISVGIINAKNSNRTRQHEAANRILTNATKERDNLHSQQSQKKSELNRALSMINEKQRFEQKKLDNYECFIRGDYTDILEEVPEPALNREAAVAKSATKKSKKKSTKTTGNEVVSPFSGRVKSLLIEDGSFVKKDQPILILEAMKMDNTINASCDGEVSFQVSEGAEIEKNTVLAVINAISGDMAWHVKLTDCGQRKIEVIKVLREYLGCGLAEAKELAEKGGIIADNFVNEEFPTELVTELRAAGANASVGAKPRN